MPVARTLPAPVSTEVRLDHDPRTWRATLEIGLSGAGMVALGSLFDGRLAPTRGVRGLIALQHVPDAYLIGVGLGLGGLVALTCAWLLLRRQVVGHPDGVRRVLVAAAVWCLPLLLVPPAFSGDVWSYVANGMLRAEHLSPYVATPRLLHGPILHAVSARWIATITPYGPLPLVWGGWLAAATSSLWLQMLGYRLLALVALGVLAGLVRALALRTGRDPALATWFVVASPYTLANGVVSAHIDVLAAMLATGAVLAAVHHRRRLAPVLVGLAAAVKLPGLLLVVPVALARLRGRPQLRERLVAGIVVAGLALLTVVAVGEASGLGLGWISGLSSPLSSLTPLSLTTEVGVTLQSWLHVSALTPARDAGLAVLALLGAGFALRGGTSPRQVVRVAAVLSAAALLLSPVVHYWYYFWCLPLLAVVPLTHRGTRTLTALTVVLGLLSGIDSTVHLPAMRWIMVVPIVAALATAIDVRRLRDRLSRPAVESVPSAPDDARPTTLSHR